MSNSLRTEPWNYECCNCDSVESFYACPINNCNKHGNEPIRWTHTNCGGSFRLYENGKEKCEKCGMEEHFCLLSCHDSHKIDYLKVKNTLAKLAGLNSRLCSPYFLIHVSICIDKQYRDHPEKFE